MNKNFDGLCLNSGINSPLDIDSLPLIVTEFILVISSLGKTKLITKKQLIKIKYIFLIT